MTRPEDGNTDDADASDVDTTMVDALQQWRQAEQVVAVSKRGRIAAEAAAEAATEAALAATATADAAKMAMAAAGAAKSSAARTAAAARMLVQVTRAELSDAESNSAMADVGEAAAHDVYRRSAARARSGS